MNFLYPAVLWALTALAIPVVIHLFNFHRYRILPFSNTQFIKAIQAEHRSRSKVRNLLLLMLRIMTIAFLVLAFAQPVIHQGDEEKADNPRVAVYIDNSFSMDADGEYGTLIEWAKTRACELTESFPPETEYLLTTNELNRQQQRWVSREQFVDWVRRVQSTHIVADIDEIINRQQMIDSDTSRMLYSFIFSDLHKPSFSSRNAKPQARQHIFLIPLRNASQNNIAIDSVWFASPGLYVGKIEELTVRIRNYGDNALHNANIQLFVNDTLKKSAPFSVEANSTVDVKCSFLHTKNGWNRGRVEIQDFPITFDNQLFFSYNILPKTNILRITSKTATDYFATLYNADSAISYTRLSPLNVVADKITDYQMIIVDASELSSGLTENIVRFVKNGGTLVLLPSATQNNEALLAQTKGPQTLGWTNSEGVASTLNTKHNIFRDALDNRQRDYTLPTYKGYFKMRANSRQQIERLFDTESGDLLFFDYKFGNGIVFASTMPFDIENTNIMTHPVFVPVFYNIALQSTMATHMFTTIRQPMHVSLGAASGLSSISITNAEGKTIYPHRQETGSVSTIYPDATDLSAGVWSARCGNDLVGELSFNFDRTESSQSYLTDDEGLEYLVNQGFKVDVVDAGPAFAQVVAISEVRLWWLFALLSLICLILETLIIRLKIL